MLLVQSSIAVVYLMNAILGFAWAVVIYGSAYLVIILTQNKPRVKSISLRSSMNSKSNKEVPVPISEQY